MLKAQSRTSHRPLCRPAGWACLWRRLGGTSVLARRGGAFVQAPSPSPNESRDDPMSL